MTSPLPFPLLIPTPTHSEAIDYAYHLFGGVQNLEIRVIGTIATREQKAIGTRDVLFILDGNRGRLTVWWERGNQNEKYLYGEW